MPDARAAIADACQDATVRRDPLGRVLLALDAAVTEMRETRDAFAAGHDLSPEDRAAMLARVDRAVWLRERAHLLRTAGAMALALALACGGGFWWGRAGASAPVFVIGTEARTACAAGQQVVQDGRRFCAVWLAMDQVGVAKTEARR